MKDAQDRIRQAGEVFIQKGRYPKLLRHEGLLVERPDLVMRLPLVDTHRCQPVRASKLFGKSESAPQSNKYFHGDFAGHGCDRKTHAPKEAVKTRERNIKYNIKYNIGPDGDEGISQGSAQDDSAASLLALAGGNTLS